MTENEFGEIGIEDALIAMRQDLGKEKYRLILEALIKNPRIPNMSECKPSPHAIMYCDLTVQ